MAVISIIKENPYRVLGVTANAPIKERVANQTKMKAFLRVGRSVPFPLDLSQYLSEVNRTTESVAQANAQLTLSKDQVKFAQFWFVNADQRFDPIAFNHLKDGSLDESISIWQGRESVTTLHNLVVCYLIKENYREAISTAEKLYSTYSKEFAKLILGDGISFDTSSLGYNFIDLLAEELTAKKLLPFVTNSDWQQHLSSASVEPLMDSITNVIASAKSSKGKGPAARHVAGIKLMNDTKRDLQQLKSLLPVGDLQYQMMADKLGLEILQCGIDYYNDSDDDDCAQKAMVLQKYAQSIVVGQMAKDRCKENVDILTKIIAELPPVQVIAEDKAIKGQLARYTTLPNTISNAVSLLINTKPKLQSIKLKLGSSNSYYLKVSTLIINAALHNVIEEVNQAQEKLKLDMFLDSYNALSNLKSVISVAWNATEIMDGFDMESAFKTDRYKPNRNALRDLCNQIGISTSKYTSLFSSSRSSSSASTSSSISPSSSSRNNYTGCLWGIGIIIFIIICIASC